MFTNAYDVTTCITVMWLSIGQLKLLNTHRNSTSTFTTNFGLSCCRLVGNLVKHMLSASFPRVRSNKIWDKMALAVETIHVNRSYQANEQIMMTPLVRFFILQHNNYHSTSPLNQSTTSLSPSSMLQLSAGGWNVSLYYVATQKWATNAVKPA